MIARSEKIYGKYLEERKHEIEEEQKKLVKAEKKKTVKKPLKGGKK